MKFKELKPGTIFSFEKKPDTLCLLSYNRDTNKNDVVFLCGNFWNATQLYEEWKEQEVKIYPELKKVLVTFAKGIYHE